jgi:spermidine synthase
MRAGEMGAALQAEARRIPFHLPAALILGLVSQVAQVLFLRELLMVFHGNELSIGIILASWLAWVGAGSRLGALLSARSHNPIFLLTLSAAAILLLLPATIWLIRGLRGFFDLLPGAYISLPDIAVSSFLLPAPVCLLLGAQFVWLSRVWRESSRAEGVSGAGKTYVVEAAGNMLGGLLFTFLLVHHQNSFQSAVMTGALMPAAVLLLIRKSAITGAAARLRPALWALLLAAALTFPLLDQLDQLAYRLQWRHFMPQHRLVETRQSKHGAISVVQRDDQYTFFQSGHLIFSTAGPETAAPGLEKQQAVHFAHLAMVQHDNPRRILLIGGGLRGVLGEIVRHPVETIDYIELDPVLTEMSGPYLPPATLAALADPRVRLIHTDGRLFVKTARERYDLIIVDLPDPITAVLNRFYTKEFFLEAAALLNPGGVLVTGAGSTPDLRGLAIANRNAAIYHTLTEVFSQVIVAGEQYIFFFAAHDSEQISVDASVLAQRYRERGIKADGFSEQHFHTLLPEGQLRRKNWVIRHHGRSDQAHLKGPAMGPLLPGPVAEQQQAEMGLPPVNRRYFINTDFRPIGYFYTLMFWNELTRAGGDEIFRLLLRLQPWWFWSGCAAFLLAALFWRATAARANKKISTGWAVLFTALATGFSAMSLQIAALFSFQSIYGFVYETVGLIMAIFMGGLAGGAYLTDRYLIGKSSLSRLGNVQLINALLAVFIAFALPRAAALQPLAVVFTLFTMLTFSAGLINGISFPLAAACYRTANPDAEKSAGAVYGAELFGACAGAILAGAVVAPVIGILACFYMAAAVNSVAFILLVIIGRSNPCLKKNYPPV